MCLQVYSIYMCMWHKTIRLQGISTAHDAIFIRSRVKARDMPGLCPDPADICCVGSLSPDDLLHLLLAKEGIVG